MDQNLVRTNVTITKKLRKAFQMEANRKYGGNMSMLLKIILADRYNLPSEIPEGIKK